MSLISCAYMRLNTERAILGATAGAVICTDPSTKRNYCLINWQAGACPCQGEIISHCDCNEPEVKE